VGSTPSPTPFASVTSMSTTVKTGRAWLAAIVTTLVVVVLLAGCGLAWEWLVDQDVSALGDPESLLGTYVYGPLAPVGSPGIIGDRSFEDSIIQLGGGLVPVVILVFLFTWIAGRAARAGSALTVLLGAWLGTVLGTALGGVAAAQVFIWRSDLPSDSLGLQQIRFERLQSGLYWGACAGLLVGLVAVLVWVTTKKRVDAPLDDGDAPMTDLGAVDPAPVEAASDTAFFPPPGKHERPAEPPATAAQPVAAPPSPPVPPFTDETVRAPQPPRDL